MNENEMNNEMNNDTQEELDPVVFEDEDGNEYSFSVVDYFFYNGEEYALLSEITDEDDGDEETGTEVIVCKVLEEEENGEAYETFDLVEDEELARKLIDVANTKLAEDEEEE